MDKIEQQLMVLVNVHRKCKRCLLLYQKTFDGCSHYTGVDENELALMLRERVVFRVNLGNQMLYGAVIVVLNMVFVIN